MLTRSFSSYNSMQASPSEREQDEEDASRGWTPQSSRHCRSVSSCSNDSSLGALSSKGAPFGFDKLDHPILDMLEDFVAGVGKPRRKPSIKTPYPNDWRRSQLRELAEMENENERRTIDSAEGNENAGMDHDSLRSPGSFSRMQSEYRTAKPPLWGLTNLGEPRDDQPSKDKYAIEEEDRQDLDEFLSRMDIPVSVASSKRLKTWTMHPAPFVEHRVKSVTPDRELSPSESSFAAPPLQTQSTEEFEITFEEAETPGSMGPLWGNHKLWERWEADHHGTKNQKDDDGNHPITPNQSSDKDLRATCQEDVEKTQSTSHLIHPPCTKRNRRPWAFKKPPRAPRITLAKTNLAVRIEEPDDFEVVFSSTPLSADQKETEADTKQHRRLFSESETKAPPCNMGAKGQGESLRSREMVCEKVMNSGRTSTTYIPPKVIVVNCKNVNDHACEEPRKKSRNQKLRKTQDGDAAVPNSRDWERLSTPESRVKALIREGKRKYFKNKKVVPEFSLFDVNTQSSENSQQDQLNRKPREESTGSPKSQPNMHKKVKSVQFKSPMQKDRTGFQLQACPVILRTPRRYQKVSNDTESSFKENEVSKRFAPTPHPLGKTTGHDSDATRPCINLKSKLFERLSTNEDVLSRGDQVQGENELNICADVSNKEADQQLKRNGTPYPNRSSQRSTRFKALKSLVNEKKKRLPSREYSLESSKGNIAEDEQMSNSQETSLFELESRTRGNDNTQDTSEISTHGLGSTKCIVQQDNQAGDTDVEESIEVSLSRDSNTASARRTVLKTLASNGMDKPRAACQNHIATCKSDRGGERRRKMNMSQKILKRVGRFRFAKSFQAWSNHSRDLTLTSTTVDAVSTAGRVLCQDSPGDVSEPNDVSCQNGQEAISVPAMMQHCKSPIKRILKGIYSDGVPPPSETKLQGRYSLSPKSCESSTTDDASLSTVPCEIKQQVLINMSTEKETHTEAQSDSQTLNILKEIQSSFKSRSQENSRIPDTKLAKIKSACQRAKQQRLQSTISAYYEEHKYMFEDLSWIDDNVAAQKEVYSPSELSMTSSLTSVESMVTKRLARDMKLLAKIQERRNAVAE